MTTQPITPTCSFCPHPLHTGERCPVCHKCKGKVGWFTKFIDAIGNAAGEEKFGG